MNPILPGAPWLIAHRSMLGINRPHKVTLNEQDYVLWQNDRGEIFALNNVCPHMQAPLSDGWICQERGTITCPFHALEFDGEGRLYREGKQQTQPIAQPLKLIVKRDCVWSYGDCESRVAIPEIVEQIASEYDFVGIAGEKTIQGDFLSTWLINSDFNHQNGTHRELFQIVQNQMTEFDQDGFWYKVKQESTRADNSLRELLLNPVLLTIPKVLKSTVEYFFPSVLVLYAETGAGPFAQVVVQYPQQHNQTKIYELIFAKLKPTWVKPLLRQSMLKAIDVIVEQDTTAIETRYPRQPGKVKLPGEEVMMYAEKLYHEW
ncbi:Rieske 2Fe-2S domain-containing protein [Chlorogloeopsis sp. ULAP01]|uniref:Rieske (2Fe-2S) protein n=1 Tax=Chlorogloeopsis sp. ULAP01 TaxID=3056483 RepID=UPI0025AA4C9C|nr:Rieske 2Fe-2S domain-containing protein [Chlorogloeopsis sp. ULAP01]MDM9385112.1 Rieske 2Fe-2S domain-containing protein [Chlorogloeopsis sp. ULAP01]